MLDRVLYRLLTGSSCGFTFMPGPGPGWTATSCNCDPADENCDSADENCDPADESACGLPPSSRSHSSSEVGLYVHVPFCRSLCAFCPYTKVLYSDELAKAYLEALVVEAKAVVARLGSRRISSVYFGGGTPMTVPDAIRMVVDLFRKHLVPGAGIGVELHPQDVDPASLGWLRDVMAGAGVVAKERESGCSDAATEAAHKSGSGWGELAGSARQLSEFSASVRDVGSASSGDAAPITMVSLGVESLNGRTLDYLGRAYGPDKAIQTVEMTMDAGFGTTNVDVMTCIPGQSADEATADMQRLLRMGVGQVSAYPLMDFSYTQGRTSHSLWSQRRTLAALAQVGEAEGYERSSVWTWTRPDARKYTSITRERFIGIGAGAATYLDGYFGVNTFDVRAYVEALSQGRSPVALHSTLTPQESALYWLFWRCYEGRVDLDSPEAGRVRGLRGWANLARMLGLGRMSGLAEGGELGHGEGESAGGGLPSVGSEGQLGGGQSHRKRVFQLNDNGLFLYHILERHYTRAYIGRLWAACREAAFPQAITL